MKRWIIRIAIALVVLTAVAVALSFVIRVPKLLGMNDVVEPGPTGLRVDENGLFGNYFPSPSNQPSPGVLIISGAEGGLSYGGSDPALALQEAGYSTLHISYFLAPGMPNDLINIPMETFVQGWEWLKSRPEVDPEKMAIYGLSRGAEAALLFASRIKEVDAVIAGVPSSVVWQGIDYSLAAWIGIKPVNSESSWTWQGEPIDYLPYGSFEPDGMFSLYANGLKAVSEFPKAVIPVEEINGPILLICGEKDTIWPACRMSRDIAERSKRLGGAEVTVLSYPEAGHYAIGVPMLDDLANHEWLGAYGGTVEANNAAREDSWARTLMHLNKVWAD